MKESTEDLRDWMEVVVGVYEASLGFVDDVRGEGEFLDWGGDFMKSRWAEEVEERKDESHGFEVEDVHWRWEY